VVVIAGTGAIALGMTADGSEGFCGGWGWLIGDEGSACDIGRRGIQAATRAWDGRAPTTTLVERFANLFQVSHFFDLKRLVYAHSLDARLFADLAPVVARAAHDGDAVARAIAVDAGHELARLAAAVIQRLPFGPELVPVAPLGGVFRAGALIHDPFKRFLRRLEPRAQVVAPVLPATCGSVLLALKMCNRLDAAVIARLSSEARQRGWDSVE
jgi:N-acetylglucosamine kinase-like BadF-type ATPase